MGYYGDKETYVPKFKLGDKVVRSWEPNRVRTIASRKVTRNAQRCDTYYRFDDAEGAWEMNLQPTSELLAPGAVLARILPMFDAPAYTLTVDSESLSLVLHISETRRVQLFADLDGGLVQTLGEWSWGVSKRNDTAPNWSVQRGTAPNLGGALVDASNTLHGYVETDPVH